MERGGTANAVLCSLFMSQCTWLSQINLPKTTATKVQQTVSSLQIKSRASSLIACLVATSQLNISYDRFIRTTSTSHAKIVAEFFQRVWDRGDIYRSNYEGLYCVACEEYKVPWCCPAMIAT